VNSFTAKIETAMKMNKFRKPSWQRASSQYLAPEDISRRGSRTVGRRVVVDR